MAAATATTNVTTLPTAKAARRPAVTQRDRVLASPRPAPSAAARRRDLTATVAGCFALGIFAAGLGLSLAHQAHGVAVATTVSPNEGWATAVLIDCGFIVSKVAPYLARTDAERAALAKWLVPLAYVCFAACAVFNAAGYTGFVPTGFVRSAVGVALGAFVPSVMLCMTQAARILLVRGR